MCGTHARVFCRLKPYHCFKLSDDLKRRLKIQNLQSVLTSGSLR